MVRGGDGGGMQKGVGGESGLGNGMPTSAFGVAVMNLFMGVASFFKLNVMGWALKEAVKNWDLPEYEEMRKAQVPEKVAK